MNMINISFNLQECFLSAKYERNVVFNFSCKKVTTINKTICDYICNLTNVMMFLYQNNNMIKNQSNIKPVKQSKAM